MSDQQEELRLPPQDMLAERSILGAMLTAGGGIKTAIQTGITADHFHANPHKLIYSTIVDMHINGVSVDLVTVADRLEKRGRLEAAGGVGELMAMADLCIHASYVTDHVQILNETWTRRTLEREFLDLAKSVSDKTCDPQTAIAEFSKFCESFNKPEESMLSARDLREKHPELSPVIIDGLARRGEAVNIVGSSKTGKSWFVMLVVFCVLMGWKLLGKFWCKQGRVLLIDNELHKPTIRARIENVARALNLQPEQYEDRLTIWSLRGQLLDINDLAVRLRPYAGKFDFVVMDALYRFLPKGCEENSNSDMTSMYNTIDAINDRGGWASCQVIHASKGNQSGKSITDVGSGAGAISRAADSHFIFRQHEQDNVAALHAVARSFPPPESFCASFKWPLWELVEGLDPNDLRQEKGKRPSGDMPPVPGLTTEQTHKMKILEVFAANPEGETKSTIRDLSGVSTKYFGPLIMALLKEKHIDSIQVKKGHATYPGLKITASGIAVLGHLGHLGQSEVSDMYPDTASSYGGSPCPSSNPNSLFDGSVSEFAGGRPA